MLNKLLFSVIVPTYNRASLIKETIYSVLEQVYFHFELIIVDDGSTDNTDEAIRPFLKDERVRCFKIKNSERGAARNFGVNNSNGDYITFLDSDDVFLPWYLTTAADKVIDGNHPPAFHLAYEILHMNGRVNHLPKLPSPVNDKLVEGNFLSCMGVFLRRDIAMANKFSEDRQLSEDYELWMRIASRVPILAFPEVTSRLINHEDRSVIKTDPKKLIMQIASLEMKLKADGKFREKFGDRLEKFSAYCALYLSLHLAMSGARWLAAKRLLYGAWHYPLIAVNYRFMVVVKKILLW